MLKTRGRPRKKNNILVQTPNYSNEVRYEALSMDSILTRINGDSKISDQIYMSTKLIGHQNKPISQVDPTEHEVLENIIEDKASISKVRSFFKKHIEILNEESKNEATFKNTFSN